MTMVAAAFVLDMMVKAQPPAGVPWRDTYATTAEAIATAANANPLFAGDEGPARTAAVMVGVAQMESSFDPKAKGDGCLERDENKKCVKRGEPQSLCAFQVGRSNFAVLGTNEEEILGDVFVCTRVALRLMHASFKICSGAEWKPIDRLNQYTTGGGVCVRPLHDEGEHRMRRGMWLYQWKISKDKKLTS